MLMMRNVKLCVFSDVRALGLLILWLCLLVFAIGVMSKSLQVQCCKFQKIKEVLNTGGGCPHWAHLPQDYFRFC